MRQMLLTTLAVLALSGCGEWRCFLGPGDVFDLAAVPADARPAIQAAVAEWNKAVPELGLRVSAGEGSWLFDDRPLTGRLGRFEPRNPYILIDIDQIRAGGLSIEWIAAHEIGHALGIHAHSTEGLISGVDVTGPLCVDETTARMLRAARPELDVTTTCE